MIAAGIAINKERTMKTKRRGALALGAMLLSAGAEAALEAKSYTVTTWNSSCES